MKYYIIAGEASGDLHGSNLMKALLNKDVSANFRFWGGDLMQAVGGELVVHYKERSFMGFTEVLMNLKKIFGLMSFCKKDIEAFQPDVIIFIDNSGFNLPIAKWAKSKNYRTNYYISPQVWASRASRVQKIKRDIDDMFVILPFEKAFYNNYGYEVNFVGHPLIDAIQNTTFDSETYFKRKHNLSDKPIIALLPGSRKQEIKKMLGVMLSVVDDFKDYQFVIAGAPSQDLSFYQSFLKENQITVVQNETYNLLKIASAALVTSGTATLETALFKVPQVVCYKANFISYHIAKRIITLKFISLVNLIMNQEIVKELIQHDLNSDKLKKHLGIILDPDYRKKMIENYNILEEKLGGVGASKLTAHLIYKKLNV